MYLKIPGFVVTSTGEVPTMFEIDVMSYGRDGEGNVDVETEAMTIRYKDPTALPNGADALEGAAQRQSAAREPKP